MDLELAGKVVLIVGATQGLGRGCAEVFAREGATLALAARTEADLSRVAQELRRDHGVTVAHWAADLTNPEAPARLVAQVHEHFGVLDSVVNTIGLCQSTEDGPLGADGFWEDAFQSVLMVAVRLARAVVPIMQRRGSGTIVNVSAMSIRHYSPTIAHYSAQKIALAHYTKNLAKQFAADGIRANAIMPGWIASEQVEKMFQGYMDQHRVSRQQAFEQLNAELGQVTYSTRPGDPIEYGNVAAFLSSNKSSYVNGAWLNVDGGSNF